MNIYQKELYHAWANKTPEGKRREKEYNRHYYSLNKYRWGVKNSIAPEGYAKPSSLSMAERVRVQKEYDKIMNMNTPIPFVSDIYPTPRYFVNSMKQVANAAKSFASKLATNVVDVAKSVKNGVKKVGEFIDKLTFLDPARIEIQHGKDWVSWAIGEAKRYDIKEHW